MESSESKAEGVYGALKQRILDGAYGPGFRVVVAEVSREMGVSNNPVREAIHRLQAEGWVEVHPNVGARVRRFSEQDHRHAMFLLARLEGLATMLALPFVTAEDILTARELNDEMVEALESFSPEEFFQLNQRFHEVLVDRCPDVHLRELLSSEQERLRLVRQSILRTIPGRARESISEHERLLQLIEQGSEPAVVEECARQHKLNGVHPEVEGSNP